MKIILLVDDAAETRELLAHYLRKNDFTVVSAENGREALDLMKLAAQNFDAIVTDQQMPVMDGREFVKAAREFGFKSTIIMWSGDVDPKIAGLDYFFEKCQIKKLTEALKLACAS